MKRRGVIVGAGVALSAVAGCLGNGQTALSEQPPENEVEDAIRTAVGESNTVALQLATAQENAGSPAEVSIDEAELRSQLEEGGGALDDVAGTDAADDYQAELAAARTYVGIVEDLLDATASLTTAAGDLEGIESSFQAGNYDAASNSLETIQPSVDDARTKTTDAQSDADSIDAQVLDPYGAKMEELTDGLATVNELVIGADELAAGYDSILTGRDNLERGQQAIQQRNFDTAESEFQSADDRFATATGHFETARQETDGQLDAQIETALCRSTALEDASTHFQNAVTATRSGDFGTARDERDQGEAAIETAGRCGQ